MYAYVSLCGVYMKLEKNIHQLVPGNEVLHTGSGLNLEKRISQIIKAGTSQNCRWCVLLQNNSHDIAQDSRPQTSDI